MIKTEGTRKSFKNTLSIKIPNSTERKQIGYSYALESLKVLLRDTWISWWECAKCGRKDYCKFALPNKTRDLQCGVAVTVLENFLEFTYATFETGDFETRQNYLDAAYYLVTFVWECEIDIGRLMNRRHVRLWAETLETHGAPKLFSVIVRARQNLDGLASHLHHLPNFPSAEAILFVEGRSEKTLIDSLSDSGLWHFQHLRVQNYKGRSNRKPQKLQLWVEDMVSKGYTLFLQGDSDGSLNDTFLELKKKLKLPEERTFAFNFDLETAIPAEILAEACHSLGLVSEISELCSELDSHCGSVSEVLTNFVGETLDKPSLAEAVGQIICDKGMQLWHDQAFQESELCRFLQFVQTAAFHRE